MNTKAKLLASLRGAMLLTPLCLTMPAMQGCGTSLGDFDEAFDQFLDDIDDADDFEEIGEAIDDFFEEFDD